MADFNTLQKRRNIVVGCFVVIGIVIFILFIFMFGEAPIMLTKHKSFYIFAQFPHAQGIQKNTPIMYCGYQIGKVFEVEPPDRLVHLDTGVTMNQVKIGLAIENKYEHKIPDNAHVMVMKRSMASSYIEFIDVNEKPTGFLTAHAPTLQGEVGSTHEFIPKEFQQKVENIADKISDLTTDLNKIVGDEDNRKNVKIALSNFVKATAQADDTLKSMKTFSDSGKHLMDDISEELTETLAKLQTTIDTINQGRGTAGKLVNDPALYDNLINASEELQLAVSQLKHIAADAREKGIKISF